MASFPQGNIYNKLFSTVCSNPHPWSDNWHGFSRITSEHSIPYGYIGQTVRSYSRGMEQDGTRFQHTTQNGMDFKIRASLFVEFSTYSLWTAVMNKQNHAGIDFNVCSWVMDLRMVFLLYIIIEKTTSPLRLWNQHTYPLTVQDAPSASKPLCHSSLPSSKNQRFKRKMSSQCSMCSGWLAVRRQDGVFQPAHVRVTST